MINIICGGAGSGKTCLVEDRIEELLQKGEKILLIVPEQASVISEFRTAKRFQGRIPFGLEVFTFHRLSEIFLRETGKSTVLLVDKPARTIAMWRAVREFSATLFQNAEKETEEVERYLSAAMELTAEGLTVENVSDAIKVLESPASPVKDGHLTVRLIQLKDIMTAYDSYLSGYFGNTDDVLDALYKGILEDPYFEGFHYFIDGFAGFTSQQFKIIEAMNSHGESVTVTLPLPGGKENDQICFQEPREALERLKRIRGAKYSSGDTQLYGNFRTDSPAIKTVVSRLWDSTPEPDDTIKEWETVQLVEAENPYLAASFIVGDILKKMQKGDCTFSNFAILAGSPNLYTGILDSTFTRNKIPFFVSRNNTLAAIEPLKLIAASLSAVTGDFRREDVMATLKCGFSGLSVDQVNRLELYTDIWNLTGDDFESTAPWVMNPEGFTEKREGATYSQRWLEEVNITKETAMKPLRKLRQNLLALSDKTVPSFTRLVFEYLFDLQIPKQLIERSNAAYQDGDLERGELYAGFWDLAVTYIDLMDSMLKDCIVDPEGYLSLLEVLFRSVDIGRIPTTGNEVMIGAANIARTENIQHVYLLGANEGEFPSNGETESFFSETDRANLSKLVKPMKDGGKGEPVFLLKEESSVFASRSLLGFLRALSCASQSVTVIWSTLSSDFAELEPSFAVERIRRIIPKGHTYIPMKDRSLIDFIYSVQEAENLDGLIKDDPNYEAVKMALANVKKEKKADESSTPQISNETITLKPETVSSAFPKNMVLSPSAIDTYLDCPLHYFLEKGIAVRSDEKVAFGANRIGSFIHALMEHLLSDDRAKEGQLSDDEIDKRIDDFSEEYLKKVGQGKETSPRLQFLLSNLRQASKKIARRIENELKGGKFKTVFTELKISNKAKTGVVSPDPFKVQIGEDDTLSVIGTVDRVDAYRSGNDVYVRVSDYKTGKHEFKINGLKDGKDMQMALYLFALWNSDNPAFRKELGVPEGGQILPAGATYLNIMTDKEKKVLPIIDSNALENDIEKTISENGVILDDDEVREALGKIVPEGANKKDVSFESLDRLKEAVTEAENTLRSIVAQMRSGEAKVSEKAGSASEQWNKSACKFCKMRPICRFGSTQNEESEGTD